MGSDDDVEIRDWVMTWQWSPIEEEGSRDFEEHLIIFLILIII